MYMADSLHFAVEERAQFVPYSLAPLAAPRSGGRRRCVAYILVKNGDGEELFTLWFFHVGRRVGRRVCMCSSRVVL